MNLPNKLTLTRIILVPVFMIFVSLSQYMTPSYNPRWYLIAGIIFAVASFTDYLDGHLARKWHMVTDFGKFADPLADKLLTTVAAPILAEGDLLGLVLFISSDDAVVTGEAEYKLAQTIAAFLGRHMEG